MRGNEELRVRNEEFRMGEVFLCPIFLRFSVPIEYRILRGKKIFCFLSVFIFAIANEL